MKIKERVKSLPDTPGVYLMKDEDGKIIYVGKATSIKKRVSSHLQRHPSSKREQMLIERTRDIEYITTNSGLEALILECNLIKRHQPRYNIRLKDDKRYPMIKVTIMEEFPRILFVRRKTNDGASYFGPYTESQNLRRSLRSIREVFPVCICKQEIKPGKKRRPCLDFYIGHCSAPCAGKIEKGPYMELVNRLCLFLMGEHKELIGGLRKKMEALAKDRNFEEAAKIRNEIFAIEALTTRQRVLLSDELDRDVIALSLKDGEASALVLDIRKGRVIGKRHLFLDGFIEDEPSALMNSFIKQYYLEKDFIPQEILIEYEIQEIDTIIEWLSNRARGMVKVYSPKDKEGLRLMELARENLERLIKKEAGDGLGKLKDLLHLSRIPARIEAFDVSNIKGRLAVASLVVFEDGNPKKDAYRHYRIKTINTPDDVGMIKEVVSRRFRRLLSEDGPLPDLVIVDGGRPQLNAVSSVFTELGLGSIPIIGIAKTRDEVFTISHKEPIRLDKDQAALSLLQHIRDEAHRFAITYHKRLRRLSLDGRT